MSYQQNMKMARTLQLANMPFFSVFDIESRDWKDFLIGGYYNGVNYETYKDINGLMELMFSTNNYTPIMYAHFGGIFDFLFIIDFLFSQGSNAKYKIDGLVCQGRKILKFEITNPKGQCITFIDSSGLFPFGLEKLTHSFDVKHKKLKEDVGNLRKVTKKLLKYLEHDCKGLHECIDIFSKTEYIDEVGLRLTRSGISFAVYKKFLEKSGKKLPRPHKEASDFARKAYFGGRTEIFKPLYINKKKPLNVYDINSLYPSVMHDYKYPSEFKHWTLSFQPNDFSIYNAVVTAPKDIKIPILAVKHDGKLIFPVGTFEGYFTNIEMNLAIKHGYVINEIINGAVFGDGGYMFKDFVDHFYNLRKKTDDTVKKIIYKDILNHLYGRLAINPQTESITFDRPEGDSKVHSVMDYGDYEIRLYSQEKFMHTYSNPVLSCFVTSYARIRLYEFMEQVNFNIYYCDTDSIFTPNKMKDSLELGDMKLEYKLKEACFLLPKTYMGVKENGDLLRKMKGFPQKNLGHIDFKSFVESVSGEIRIPKVITNGGLAGLKTAMKKKEILHVLPDSTKQLRSKYDKRIIVKDKNDFITKPIILAHQQPLFDDDIPSWRQERIINNQRIF